MPASLVFVSYQAAAAPSTKFGFPLCFENDPFCLSRNPCLLITIRNACVPGRQIQAPSRRSSAPLHALLPSSVNHLPSFQSFAHSLQERPGCTLERIPAPPSNFPLSSRTNPERPLHPWPLGGTIFSVIALPGVLWPGKHFRSTRCLRFKSGQRAQPRG